MMEEYSIALGTIAVTLSFTALTSMVVLKDTIKNGSLFEIIMIVGFVVGILGLCLLMSVIWSVKDEKKKKQQKEWEENQDRIYLRKFLAQTLLEIKGLRQDLNGGDKNGGSENKST